MTFDDARILVFCKAPHAGRTKTRLIPLLGAEGANQLHMELAVRIIELVRESRLAEVELWCDPDASHHFFDSLAIAPDRRLEQVGRDLGARMGNALAATLSRPGIKRAILVGTDCPTIDLDYMQTAIMRLDDHDAVIGPAEDGGYGLVGLRQPNPELFEGITWGGDDVCAETCRVLNRQRANWSLLPLIWDVDRPADVARYRMSKLGTR